MLCVVSNVCGVCAWFVCVMRCICRGCMLCVVCVVSNVCGVCGE